MLNHSSMNYSSTTHRSFTSSLCTISQLCNMTFMMLLHTLNNQLTSLTSLSNTLSSMSMRHSSISSTTATATILAFTRHLTTDMVPSILLTIPLTPKNTTHMSSINGTISNDVSELNG